MKSQTVLIEDTKYTLDVDRAIELGILKTLTRKLKFSDIKVGETFCFITSNFKGIYVKTDIMPMHYMDCMEVRVRLILNVPVKLARFWTNVSLI